MQRASPETVEQAMLKHIYIEPGADLHKHNALHWKMAGKLPSLGGAAPHMVNVRTTTNCSH